MKKNLKCYILTGALLGASILGITGCSSSMDITEDEKQLVIEYAVNQVINHDKNYIEKLAERETEPEEPTTWLSENPDRFPDNPEKQTGNNEEITDSTGNQNGQTLPQENFVSVNEVFNLNGFTVKGNGYEIADKYPNNNDGFSMVAISKCDLLILKFNVTNNTGSPAALNMLGMNYKYRCIVNGDMKLNAQVTALLNGMNTWNGTFAVGETKEMVLVFQMSEEVSSNLESISISVVKDSGVSTAAIK